MSVERGNFLTKKRGRKNIREARAATGGIRPSDNLALQLVCQNPIRRIEPTEPARTINRCAVSRFVGGIVGTVCTSTIVLAWTGRTSAPPNDVTHVKGAALTTDSIKLLIAKSFAS